jgi:plastocyanin
MTSRLLLTVLMALCAGPILAGGPDEPATIGMFAQAFLPTQVTVRNGETVTWEWQAGSHIVSSGQPDDGVSPEDRLFRADVNQANPIFTFRFETAGEFSFFDELNVQAGGVGSISVLTDAITHRVGVVDNAYIPEDVFIFEGDTIHWEHEPNEAFHTVTSGLSSNQADNPGAVFDAESSDARPNFFWTFETPEIFPYFCIPHEHLGMVGTVIVQRKFIRGDYGLDGVVDLSDAINLLGTLFLGDPPLSVCPDSADANDDGLADLTDAIFILEHQILGSVEISKPFPTPGPDRTPDELRCMPDA